MAVIVCVGKACDWSCLCMHSENNGSHFDFILSDKGSHFKGDWGEEFCYWPEEKASARTGKELIQNCVCNACWHAHSKKKLVDMPIN